MLDSRKSSNMAKKVPNPVDKHVGSRVSKSFRLGVRTMFGARDASTAAAVYVRAHAPLLPAERAKRGHGIVKASSWSVVSPAPRCNAPPTTKADGPTAATPSPCRPAGSGASLSQRPVFGS